MALNGYIMLYHKDLIACIVNAYPAVNGGSNMERGVCRFWFFEATNGVSQPHDRF